MRRPQGARGDRGAIWFEEKHARRNAGPEPPRTEAFGGLALSPRRPSGMPRGIMTIRGNPASGPCLYERRSASATTGSGFSGLGWILFEGLPVPSSMKRLS